VKLVRHEFDLEHLDDFVVFFDLYIYYAPVVQQAFCELRPGLIGWVVLNLGMAAKEVLFLTIFSLAVAILEKSDLPLSFLLFYFFFILHSKVLKPFRLIPLIIILCV
tara:strand:- start:208 stop:528 length:321 start_codon:yes stop_codon:yes gene_type:complete